MVNNVVPIISQSSRYLIIFLFFIYGCNDQPNSNVVSIETKAVIEPDYSEVTIPPNIAPLNFEVKETGLAYFVKFLPEMGAGIEVSSRNGEIRIPEDKWRKMLQTNTGKKFQIEIYTKNEGPKWSKFSAVPLRFHPNQ